MGLRIFIVDQLATKYILQARKGGVDRIITRQGRGGFKEY